MGTTTTFAVTSKDLVDWQLALISQLSTYTLAYIGFAIAIILALGGIFYLFTLKPFEKELQRQAQEIRDSKELARAKIELESKSLEEKIGLGSNEIKTHVNNTLKEFEKRIQNIILEKNNLSSSLIREEITKSISEEAIKLSSIKENLIQEIRGLDKKIASSDTLLATQGKDLQAFKSSQQKLERDSKDLDIRLRVFETEKYSKENKMGSITIPLRTIEELIESQNDWKLPGWLESLKKEVTGVALEAEWKTKITDVLAKLPAKYEIIKNEILEIVRKDGVVAGK